MLTTIAPGFVAWLNGLSTYELDPVEDADLEVKSGQVLTVLQGDPKAIANAFSRASAVGSLSPIDMSQELTALKAKTKDGIADVKKAGKDLSDILHGTASPTTLDTMTAPDNKVASLINAGAKAMVKIADALGKGAAVADAVPFLNVATALANFVGSLLDLAQAISAIRSRTFLLFRDLELKATAGVQDAVTGTHNLCFTLRDMGLRLAATTAGFDTLKQQSNAHAVDLTPLFTGAVRAHLHTMYNSQQGKAAVVSMRDAMALTLFTEFSSLRVDLASLFVSGGFCYRHLEAVGLVGDTATTEAAADKLLGAVASGERSTAKVRAAVKALGGTNAQETGDWRAWPGDQLYRRYQGLPTSDCPYGGDAIYDVKLATTLPWDSCVCPAASHAGAAPGRRPSSPSPRAGHVLSEQGYEMVRSKLWSSGELNGVLTKWRGLITVKQDSVAAADAHSSRALYILRCRPMMLRKVRGRMCV